MGIYDGENKMTVSNKSSRQTFMDNAVEEDREREMDRRRQVQHGGLVAHGGGHRELCRTEENPCGRPLTRGIHSLKERERCHSWCLSSSTESWTNE